MDTLMGENIPSNLPPFCANDAVDKKMVLIIL